MRDDAARNTVYTVNVQATDNNQIASAEVIVTVLRDLFRPTFSNLPTNINVDEDSNTNVTVFSAVATDQDIQVFSS